MGRCFDERHPFCFIDCPGNSCLAYYEEATQRCHRECTTDKLDKLLEGTLDRYGLGTVTNLHAKGIRSYVLHKITRVYLRASQRSQNHPDAAFIQEEAGQLDDFLGNDQQLPPLREIRWIQATPLLAVRTLANALLRPQAG